MANLSFADPVYDEAGLSYDSDILSEVHDHDHYQDAICEYHEEHEMHDDVQLKLRLPVVQSNVSSVPNDAYMMIFNDMHELHANLSLTTTRKHSGVNKVAIGYKNPLCLTHAKQVQHALYNGYEIIKNNHVSALVHNTEDTLEIAEITRRKMNDKMKDPECVTHKVKIAPPDYSKENYLATFTPQKQLTPEQIFWSQDLIKMKE
ncbi:hypothetical protein Tco_0702407 [Tanacetum coccineum]|uniref:Uncharacterized protein n=1 Tax=Tanacetum coccineum TaxID=301880 RepID=A0ABQ4XWI0_9ASTR